MKSFNTLGSNELNIDIVFCLVPDSFTYQGRVEEIEDVEFQERKEEDNFQVDEIENVEFQEREKGIVWYTTLVSDVMTE
jgi:hypothetical protein